MAEHALSSSSWSSPGTHPAPPDTRDDRARERDGDGYPDTMTDTTGTTSSRPTAQRVAVLIAGVFLLVGVLGFIPGVTTNFGDLRFAGPYLAL